MHNRLSKIKILAIDVDGTLTDGAITFCNGEQVKSFHVHDGLGIRLAMNHGLRIAWITGNVASAVEERAGMLGVEDVYQGARHKSEALVDLATRYDVSVDEIAYIGDDLNDLPAFRVAGFTFAVGDAAAELRETADAVTQRAGGCGAVREAIETILKSRGEWEEASASFLDELRKEEAGKLGPEAVG